MNELGVSQAGLNLVVTILVILYVGAMIWGILKHPRPASLISLVMMFAMMYVGWTLRGWPTAPKDAGLVLTLIIAWRDSAITLLYAAAHLIGLDKVWNRWFGPFFKKGPGR